MPANRPCTGLCDALSMCGACATRSEPSFPYQVMEATTDLLLVIASVVAFFYLVFGL